MKSHAVTAISLNTAAARPVLALVASKQPAQNHLLAALPLKVRAELSANLEVDSLAAGQVLYESGTALGHAYFPTDAVVSLQTVMRNGASAEIAVVGKEGMIGVALFMGGNSTPSRAVVQSAGHAYRLRGHILKQMFTQTAEMQMLLLRYSQALLTQMAQTAVCNRHHTVNQQLCRNLLMNLDRLPGNQLLMTHEMIAGALGVRREGVTEAARKLQSADLIAYSRGRITVLDRARLEQHACECYGAVKTEFARLLPAQAPAVAVPTVRFTQAPAVSVRREAVTLRYAAAAAC